MADPDALERVRGAFPQLVGAAIEPLRGGLINASFLVRADAGV